MPLDVGRITHLADKMHRAEASNGTAIASNWILSTDGTKGVHWRPETTGGTPSLSYGSNANDVGDAGAAGASSLVTRADHVHRGVRSITANGSNSLFGNVNLKAGSGIALGVTAQDITITNLSGGSSGGSGTSLTIEEVDGSPTVAATKLVLPNGTLGVVGTVATYTPSAGGGTLDWELAVNESGASFANFTAVTGTWSSNGTEIIQTNNAASFVKAYFNTFQEFGFPTIAEVEVWFHSAGQGGGGLNYASLQLGLNGTSDGAPCIILDRGSGVMRWQLWGVTDIRTVSTTVNADTWYKIRLVADGLRISGFKDGTLLGTTHYAPGNGGADRIALGSYASTVKFRNLKVWTLSTGAPA
jgi:hypothetical protein